MLISHSLLVQIIFITLKNIYLFLAASGLSCGTRDLSLWRTGFSLVVVCGIIVAARGLIVAARGLSSYGMWA